MREMLTQNEASRFYLWSQTSEQDHIVTIYPRDNGQRGIGYFLLEINTIVEEIYTRSLIAKPIYRLRCRKHATEGAYKVTSPEILIQRHRGEL